MNVQLSQNQNGSVVDDLSGVEIRLSMKRTPWCGGYCFEIRFACAPVSRRQSDDRLTYGRTLEDISM